jgi:hypothetical protein
MRQDLSFGKDSMMQTVTSRARFLVTVSAAVVLAVALGWAAPQAAGSDGSGKDGNGSVAAHLGGYPGILNFLNALVVPAEVADPVVGPFLVPNIKENALDLEKCLALLLDHDLGGSSPHFGMVLEDGHQCRSSMSNIHRGFNIPDHVIDRFIEIVGEQATIAGVPTDDIQAVAKALNTYRGGVRNK